MEEDIIMFFTFALYNFLYRFFIVEKERNIKLMNESNKIKKLVKMGVLVAISIVLVYLIRIPIFPSAPFLEYDPGAIPMLIASFAFGPLSGLTVTVVTAVLQGVTVSAGSGPYGVIMNIMASGTFVVVAGIIYKKNKTMKMAIVGLCCGILAATLIMIPANYIFTPLFLGATTSAVTVMLPVIIGFNLIRTGINAAITFLLYKRVRKFLDS